MNTRVIRLTSEPLTQASFAPFGEVHTPRPSHTAVTNIDLLNSGRAQMSDPVRPERMGDWDILDYWPDIGAITRDTMKLGYVRCRAKAMRFNWFERHLKGTQSLFPVGGGRSVLAVAPANDPREDSGLPPIERTRAFLLDGTLAVTLRPGTWHWTPFPVGAATCDFIYLVREQVVEDDLNFVDTEARQGVRFEVAI